jgi:hypothetical protein
LVLKFCLILIIFGYFIYAHLLFEISVLVRISSFLLDDKIFMNV